MISATGLLSIVLSGSLLIYLVCFFLRKDGWLAYAGPRVIIWFLMIVTIRMLIPFELGFEKSIYIEQGLPALRDFLITPIAFLGITVSPGDILLVVWITGAVICFSESLFSFFEFKRSICKIAFPCPVEAEIALSELCQKRSGRSANFKLVCTPSTDTPLVTGLWDPVTAIPNLQLSSEEWAYVLRHEIAHYDNHDLWVKLFGELVCAVYWWNPITRLFRLQLDRMQELHADEVVTQYMSDLETVIYTECLVKSAKQSVGKRSVRGAVALTTKEAPPLKQRVKLLLANDRQTKEARQRHLVPSMLMSAVLLVSVFSFIIEPEYPKPVGAIALSPENSFLILKDDGQYDIYIDDAYRGRVYDNHNLFSDLPVYNSIDEVTQNESS